MKNKEILKNWMNRFKEEKLERIYESEIVRNSYISLRVFNPVISILGIFTLVILYPSGELEGGSSGTGKCIKYDWYLSIYIVPLIIIVFQLETLMLKCKRFLVLIGVLLFFSAAISFTEFTLYQYADIPHSYLRFNIYFLLRCNCLDILGANIFLSKPLSLDVLAKSLELLENKDMKAGNIRSMMVEEENKEIQVLLVEDDILSSHIMVSQLVQNGFKNPLPVFTARGHTNPFQSW